MIDLPPPLLTILFLYIFSFPITIIFLSLIHYLYTKRKKRNTDPNFKVPPQGPTFQQFFPSGMKAENQLSITQKYGDIFAVPSPFPLLIPHQVVINEPAIVKELCIKQSNMYRDPCKFTTRQDVFAKATRAVVGKGVTGLKGPEWHWRKVALLKEFHRNRLLSNERGLLSVIIQEGKLLCEALDQVANTNDTIQVDHLTTQAAVGVVLFFLFGRRIEFDTNEMRKAAKDMIDGLFARITIPFYDVVKYIPSTTAYKTEVKVRNAQKIIDDVVGTELDLLLEEYHGRKEVHSDRKKGSVMESLIANEDRFRMGGKESMLSEARVFVQAGFETTAHSLAFAIGMMAERPDIAKDMVLQGRDIIGEHEADDVEKMKEVLEKTTIVRNFFNEALRLYPLAPVLGGKCTENIEVVTKDGVKYTLSKGTITLFLNLPLQRRVSDPDEIRPDRWDVPIKEQPFLHTFQHGPHTCPGRPLSLLEGHVFLLMIAMQFEFEFPKGVNKIEFDDNGLLRPKNGMPLLVKRRL